MADNSHYDTVCFGEILWDILPSGTVPGGAPMNVAYHLKKLGSNPALITRIGNDVWGTKLLALMQQSGITQAYIQTDATLETGKVNATVGEHNEVTYDIMKPVAWDNIQYSDELATLVSQSTHFVFGSLAARSDVSAATLAKLLEAAPYKVLDINLRAPHYNRAIIEKLFGDIDLLKLNEAELALITGWFAEYKSEEARMRMLQDKFNIPNIVVTKGGDGAMFISDGVLHTHPGYAVTVADTVGSGDSFLAALLTKTKAGSNGSDALAFACGTGSLIASYNGACPAYDPNEIEVLMEKG